MSASAYAAYPERHITLVVPFSAGGPTDKTARDLVKALNKTLGPYAMVVENVEGAGGTLGAAKVARAEPDGYTLLFAHTGLATAQLFYSKLPFDALRDFEYLGVIAEVPLVLIGRPTLTASSMPKLMQWLKLNKSKVTIATAGVGSTSHLCATLLQSQLQTPLTSVPYRGIGPAMSDLLEGHVDLLCDQTISANPQIEGGHVKTFGVTTLTRLTNLAALKTTPTLNESGVSGFNIMIWQALYAPKGTPDHIVEGLNKALRTALHDPEFLARQKTLGVEVVTDNRLSPAGHKEFMSAEMAKWSSTIKATNGLPSKGSAMAPSNKTVVQRSQADRPPAR